MKHDHRPLISVIMPAYNCEAHIQRAIDSILAQSITDYELLILDDASTDETRRRIDQYQDPRIAVHQNTHNLGYLKSTNKLFDLCRGNYITFQDADDWSHPDRFKKQYNILLTRPDTALCGSFCTKHYQQGLEIQAKYPRSHEDIERSLTSGRTSLFCGASIFFKREILSTIGGYREIFDRIGAEDIDWYLRALEHFQGINIPEPLYIYRQHLESVSKTRNISSLKYHSADLAYAFYLQRKASGHDDADTPQDQLHHIFESQQRKSPPGIVDNAINMIIGSTAPKTNSRAWHSFLFKILLSTLSSHLALKWASKKRLKTGKRIVQRLQQSLADT